MAPSFLRAVFLADSFVNDAFRRELLRVLNHSESVNALKRDLRRPCRQLPGEATGRTRRRRLGRIAPIRTEGINLRGVFRFQVETYAEKLLPSAPRTTVTGAN